MWLAWVDLHSHELYGTSWPDCNRPTLFQTRRVSNSEMLYSGFRVPTCRVPLFTVTFCQESQFCDHIFGGFPELDRQRNFLRWYTTRPPKAFFSSSLALLRDHSRSHFGVSGWMMARSTDIKSCQWLRTNRPYNCYYTGHLQRVCMTDIHRAMTHAAPLHVSNNDRPRWWCIR